MDRLERSDSDGESARLGTGGRIALGVFAVVAAYFLWTEHRAHVVAYLPWALLALCPLMHLFMHRGHGSHGNHARRDEQRGREL